MEIKWSVGLFFFLLSFSSLAQESMTFTDLDTKSYKLYEEARWGELAELGNKGLDEGFDYYYLRLRLGIALYNLNRYEKACKHFRKALDFNEGDPLAQEYLYYSLIFSGRHQEARFIYSEIPELTKKEFEIHSPKGLESVFFEGGAVAVNNVENLISNNPEGPFVYHYLLKSYSYFSSGARVNLGKRLNLSAGINSMGFNALQEVYLSELQAFEFEHENSQLGFYLGGEYTIHPNWYLNLAGHFIKGEFNYNAYTPDMMGMPQFSEVSLDYKDYVIEGEIKHRLSTILAGISASYSDFNDQPGLQAGLDLTWYPAGNLNLYFQTHIDRLFPGDDDEEGSWVTQGLTGVKLLPHLWMEVHAGFGEMAEWSEKSAYIVYNNQDPILKRGGVNLLIPEVVPGLSLNFRYQLQQREHSWEVWNGNVLEDILLETYLCNSIIGGFTWKF